jgi:hypothetical protein
MSFKTLKGKVEELTQLVNTLRAAAVLHEKWLGEIRNTCTAHKWAGKAGYGECSSEWLKMVKDELHEVEYRGETAIIKCCATCNNSPVRGGTCSSSGIVRGCATGKWEQIKPARMLPAEDIKSSIKQWSNIADALKMFFMENEITLHDFEVLTKFVSYFFKKGVVMGCGKGGKNKGGKGSKGGKGK